MPAAGRVENGIPKCRSNTGQTNLTKSASAHLVERNVWFFHEKDVDRGNIRMNRHSVVSKIVCDDT